MELNRYMRVYSEGVGSHELEEDKPFVYKAVRLITSQDAKNLGVYGDDPQFVSQVGRGSVYAPGAIVEASSIEREHGGIFAFPKLKTALDFECVVAYGTPFTGFIAVGQSAGEYFTEPVSPNLRDLCMKTERMQVFGMRAFVKEVEIREGYIDKNVYYDLSYFLGPVRRIEDSQGQIVYAFNITDNGEVVFRDFLKGLKV